MGVDNKNLQIVALSTASPLDIHQYSFTMSQGRSQRLYHVDAHKNNSNKNNGDFKIIKRYNKVAHKKNSNKNNGDLKIILKI